MPFPAPNRREDNHGRRPYPRQGKVPKSLHLLNLGGSRSAGGDFVGWSTERGKDPNKWHCAVPRPQRPKRGGRGGGGRKARGRGGRGWPRRQEPQKGVSSLLLDIIEILRNEPPWAKPFLPFKTRLRRQSTLRSIRDYVK